MRSAAGGSNTMLADDTERISSPHGTCQIGKVCAWHLPNGGGGMCMAPAKMGSYMMACAGNVQVCVCVVCMHVDIDTWRLRWEAGEEGGGRSAEEVEERRWGQVERSWRGEGGDHVEITWRSRADPKEITWRSQGDHVEITWRSQGDHVEITWRSQ